MNILKKVILQIERRIYILFVVICIRQSYSIRLIRFHWLTKCHFYSGRVWNQGQTIQSKDTRVWKIAWIQLFRNISISDKQCIIEFDAIIFIVKYFTARFIWVFPFICFARYSRLKSTRVHIRKQNMRNYFNYAKKLIAMRNFIFLTLAFGSDIFIFYFVYWSAFLLTFLYAFVVRCIKKYAVFRSLNLCQSCHERIYIFGLLFYTYEVLEYVWINRCTK